MRPTSTQTKRRPHTGKKETKRKWWNTQHLRCLINRIAPVCISIDFDLTPSWCARHKQTNRVRHQTTGCLRPVQNGQIRHVWSFPPHFLFSLFFFIHVCVCVAMLPSTSSSSFTGAPLQLEDEPVLILFYFFWTKNKKKKNRHAIIYRRLWFITSLFLFFFFPFFREE
jgi:hypothetical protein